MVFEKLCFCPLTLLFCAPPGSSWLAGLVVFPWGLSWHFWQTITSVGPPSGVLLSHHSLLDCLGFMLWPRRRTCFALVITICKISFYLFVLLLLLSFYLASAPCTWLRHFHVTASMPWSRSGCVSYCYICECINLSTNIYIYIHQSCSRIWCAKTSE